MQTPSMVTTLGCEPISCIIFISWTRSSTSFCALFSWTKEHLLDYLSTLETRHASDVWQFCTIQCPIPLKVCQSTKSSLMASLVSKDTSTHHWRPLRQASSFPVETNTAYMSAWEFIAQLRCSFALSRLVITRTVQFRIQNMALLCWLLAPLHHLNIKQ